MMKMMKNMMTTIKVIRLGESQKLEKSEGELSVFGMTRLGLKKTRLGMTRRECFAELTCFCECFGEGSLILIGCNLILIECNFIECSFDSV